VSRPAAPVSQGGFFLYDLYAYAPAQPKAPRETWQYICDDAVCIVGTIGDLEISNEDTKVRNSLILCDPIMEKYRVRMIHFGLCEFRKPDESERDWRETRSYTDDEGGIGMVMERSSKSVAVAALCTIARIYTSSWTMVSRWRMDHEFERVLVVLNRDPRLRWPLYKYTRFV
jgi:hypothetical protein